MKKIRIPTIFPILILFILMAALSACPGKSDTNSPASGNSGDSGGRIITPDGDWDQAEQDDDGEEDPGSESPSGNVDEPEGGTGHPVFGDSADEAEKIRIELYIDDILQPVDIPVQVYENMPTEAEFRLTSIGSTLEAYEIKSAAMPDAPRIGLLEEMTAVVPYIFSYNSTTWGDWGIVIMVRSKDGDMVSRNWMVKGAPMGGFPDR